MESAPLDKRAKWDRRKSTVCRLVVIGGQYKHPTSIIDTDDISPITVQTHHQFDRSLSLPCSKINSDTSAIVLVNRDKEIKTESHNFVKLNNENIVKTETQKV